MSTVIIILKSHLRSIGAMSVLLLCFLFYACVMEGPSVSVHIVNFSKEIVFVTPLFDTCDTCETMWYVRKYCSGDNSFFAQLYPKDSTIIALKNYGREKLLIVNVDSIKSYRKKGSNFSRTSKKWVKIMMNNNITENTKSSRFIIDER